MTYKIMGEVLPFDREAAAQENESAEKALERSIVELRNSIGGDKISLLARNEELKKLEGQLEAAEEAIKSAPDVKSALEAMKAADPIVSKISETKAARGKLLWDLRVKSSDFKRLQDMTREKGINFDEIIPPFTEEEDAWFKKGEEITAKTEEMISGLTESIPFTPEEEAWFEKGEKKAA